MDKGVGWADPAVYAKMTDLVFENASATGDKKPDPASLYTNEFVGKVKLSDAEWTKAKAASAKYALG
jgi:hypothetical protein